MIMIISLFYSVPQRSRGLLIGKQPALIMNGDSFFTAELTVSIMGDC